MMITKLQPLTSLETDKPGNAWNQTALYSLPASYDAAAGCRCSAYPATPISEVRGRKPLHVLCQHAHRPFHLRRTQARPVPVCLHPSIIVSRVHAPAARWFFLFWLSRVLEFSVYSSSSNRSPISIFAIASNIG